LLMGFFGTWLNVRVAQEALTVSQQGQITDRFTKAIEQLGATEAGGKPKLEVRLGGIYALERIANQSERDYWPIVEVLSTYVRENAPLKPQESPPKNEAPTTSPTPAADIQAILTILGRRERKYEKENQHLDLTNADIRGANLKDANLSGANLRGANLSGARLVTADLNGAYLIEANLNGATLDGAYLIGANLRGANLRGANLRGANLRGANLIRAGLDEIYLNGADLRGANLRGADLRQANNLTQEQVDAALGNSATQLPENLHMPEKWKK